MKAHELLCTLSHCQGIPDIEIDSVVENATLANAHSVFICIRGVRHDGHLFASQAYEQGCRIFVAEQTLSLPCDAVVIRVSNTRKALATLACRLYGDPSHRMHLIAITGTKGKTTTAQLIFKILNANGISCGYIGTNGISYQGIRLPTRNTTPDALTLQRSLGNMLDAGVHTAVIEVSSQALMQHRVDGIRFRTLLFTNLSPDHIGQNEHPDFEHYKACKHRLFTDFDSETVIYNADDPSAADMLKDTVAAHRISCSVSDEKNDYAASNVALLRDRAALGVSFKLHTYGETRSCSLPLLGTVNASNALLALATANAVFGLSLDCAVESLRQATVDGRSEIFSLPNGACAVIDYAHNGTSLRQLLSTLAQYRPTRLIALFGSIGERAQMRRKELGEAAAELCDICFLTSDNPAHEDPNAIIEDIAEAFSGSDTLVFKIPDRAEAIRKAISMTRSGDILVLAGKGHESYQLIGDEKLPFCEREILEGAIRALVP